MGVVRVLLRQTHVNITHRYPQFDRSVVSHTIVWHHNAREDQSGYCARATEAANSLDLVTDDRASIVDHVMHEVSPWDVFPRTRTYGSSKQLRPGRQDWCCGSC